MANAGAYRIRQANPAERVGLTRSSRALNLRALLRSFAYQPTKTGRGVVDRGEPRRAAYTYIVHAQGAGHVEEDRHRGEA